MKQLSKFSEVALDKGHDKPMNKIAKPLLQGKCRLINHYSYFLSYMKFPFDLHWSTNDELNPPFFPHIANQILKRTGITSVGDFRSLIAT